MKIYLDEQACKATLAPLSLTRHVADIRVGILTILEKWTLLLKGQAEIIIGESCPKNAIAIPAHLIPCISNYQSILNNPQNNTAPQLFYPWHIVQHNDWAIKEDYLLLTKGRNAASIPSSVQTVCPENIFIEEGADLSYCTINAAHGPVYIGKKALVMEGVCIRGPFALGENATVKMGATIYGATTIGPYCVAGGEIKNSMLMGYSNKAHEGYLGDSVIGEWCNLGAGTVNSNVKNNAASAAYTINRQGDKVQVGPKAGLVMGDYSRTAINTSFNTASMVGVCCHVMHRDFPPSFLPDFSWGEESYRLDKAFEHIAGWKQMKGHQLTDKEKQVLTTLYSISNQH